MKKNSFFIGYFLFLTACRPTNHTAAETVTSIIAADNRADIEQVISLYTDDAILLPAGKENITGKSAIRKNYETIFLNSRLQLTPVIEEEIQSGKLAVIRGTIKGSVISKTDNTNIAVSDKFMMILKNESSGWKIHRLMWSKKE